MLRPGAESYDRSASAAGHRSCGRAASGAGDAAASAASAGAAAARRGARRRDDPARPPVAICRIEQALRPI